MVFLPPFSLRHSASVTSHPRQAHQPTNPLASPPAPPAPLLPTCRFNQNHLPSHKMEERPQERTWLHALQATNPTLSIDQIMQLANLQFA